MLEADTTILHLATGDAALARAADEALARHGALGQRFSDVYATLVFLLRNKACRPALVVVGLDGLAADEVRIVEHIREVWGEVPLMAYAAHAIPMGTVAGVPVRITAAQVVAAIDEFCAAAKLEHRAPAGIGRAANDESARVEAAGWANHTKDNVEQDERIASEDLSGDARPRADLRRDRSILTTEELAALLGGFEP